MPEAFTPAEAVSLKRAVQEIELFLRLASLRISDKPDVLPFRAEQGNLVISWLRALATRYGNGEDLIA